MTGPVQQPVFSNDEAEIVIVDETVGVIDTSHRPASAATRKAIEKQLAKEAEIRRLMKNGKTADKKRKKQR